MASCRARGACVSLLDFCFREENRGRITGCIDWKTDAWRAAANISAADLRNVLESGLCVWEGKDLLVDGYDLHGQDKLEVKRAQGDAGFKGARFGHLGGRPKKPPQGDSDNPQRGIRDNPPSPVPVPVPVPDQSQPTTNGHPPADPGIPKTEHQQLREALAKHGFALSPATAVQEWDDLLRDRAQCVSHRERVAALAEFATRARAAGLVIRYAREATEAADAWALWHHPRVG